MSFISHTHCSTNYISNHQVRLLYISRRITMLENVTMFLCQGHSSDGLRSRSGLALFLFIGGAKDAKNYTWSYSTAFHPGQSGISSYYSTLGDHDHTDDHRMTRLSSSGHPSVTPQSPPGQTSCVRRKVIASYDNLSPCPSHNMWVFCLWVTMNSVNFFAHTDRSFSSVADKSTSIAGQGCFAQYQMYVLDVMYRRRFYLYGVGRDPQPEREWSRAYKFHYYYYC